MSDTDSEDDNSGTPAASSPTTPGGSSVASMVYNGLLQRKVSPQVALGAIGSLMGESGKQLGTNSVNKGDGSDGSDSIGFAQWNGPRAAALRAQAAKMGLQWNDPKAQTAHLFNELDGPYSQVLQGLQGGRSVDDGNSIWTKQYEVPANADAQVNARLGHGQALWNAQQAGTLNLDKTGGMGDINGPPQSTGALSMGQGALSGGGMGGMDVGALYRMAMQGQQPQQPDFFQRLGNAGAALASISNPGQAQALSQIANQNTSRQPNNMVALTQALNAAAQMKNLNQVKPLQFQEVSKDGKMASYTDPNTGELVTKPTAPGWASANEDSEKIPPSPVLTNYNKAVGAASQVQNSLDEINRLDKQLTSGDGNIDKELNGTSQFSSFLNNFSGSSTDMSQFQKASAAAAAQYVIALQGSIPNGGRVTDAMRKMEMETVAPSSSMNDPVTLHEVFGRMRDKLMTNYNNQQGSAGTYAQSYPEHLGKMPLKDPISGADTTLADYHASNLKRWGSDKSAIDTAYPAFKAAHDQRSGQAPKPKSFLESAYGNLGIK